MVVFCGFYRRPQHGAGGRLVFGQREQDRPVGSVTVGQVFDPVGEHPACGPVGHGPGCEPLVPTFLRPEVVGDLSGGPVVPVVELFGQRGPQVGVRVRKNPIVVR